MENNAQDTFNRNDLESFFLNSSIDINLGNFIVAILLSLILAYVVKFTYIKVSTSLNDKEHFSETFVPLAIITTLVITVIKFSLALSLGLVGALSIVRFRAAIKEPEELVYLFICIAIGLGYGANQVTITIIGFLLTILSVVLIRKSAFNSDKPNVLYLTISKKSKSRLKLNKIIEVLEKNSFEVDLKRLDENLTKNEVSFVTSFKTKSQLLKLRENLFKLDNRLEVTFLDNTKIF